MSGESYIAYHKENLKKEIAEFLSPLNQYEEFNLPHILLMIEEVFSAESIPHIVGFYVMLPRNICEAIREIPYALHFVGGVHKITTNHLGRLMCSLQVEVVPS